MQELEITITHPSGLHLRPAALFVQTAAGFAADIRVRNVSRDTAFQNAKSALGILMLSVSSGHTILIQAEGDDAAAALATLRDLIEKGFEPH